MRRLSLASTVLMLATAKLTLNIATRFVYAFLPAIARGLGVSVGAVGSLTAVRWGVGAFTPATVRVAGREHRRRILVTGLALFTVGAAVTAAFGVFAGALVGFVLMGLGKPLFDTGAQAVIADRVEYGKRASIIGILETTWALGFLVGAPLAGWLIQRWGWAAPFWAVAAAAVLMIIPVARTATDSGPRSMETVRIRLDRRATAFLVAAVMIAASPELVFITFATWLEDVHDFGLGGLALLATTIGVVELIAEGATILFTDRLGKSRAVALGMATCAIGFTTLALTSGSLPPALAGLVIGIGGFEFAIVSSISLATELVPATRIQYLSRMVVAQALGRAIAAIVGLALYSAVGVSAVGLAAAAIAGAAVWILSTRVRDDGGIPTVATGDAA
jgi:predicted MFS family arabinose efflux permease